MMNTTTAEKTGLRMSSDIVGRTVSNQQNENIGSINDLVIDSEKGMIRFAIVGIGGFLGMGETNVAVPWSAFHESDRDQFGEFPDFVVNSTRKQLENAPRFDRDKLDELHSREVAEPIFLHYQVRYF